MGRKSRTEVNGIIFGWLEAGLRSTLVIRDPQLPEPVTPGRIYLYHGRRGAIVEFEAARVLERVRWVEPDTLQDLDATLTDFEAARAALLADQRARELRVRLASSSQSAARRKPDAEPLSAPLDEEQTLDPESSDEGFADDEDWGADT
ncbi:hypothetical protein DFQ59_1144 [Thioalbus denitrificans]|uniref:Uncharacterized protein n=1 Tax=Thioalbus denitrificans TaxID=547122 RepID=A0A369BVV1_9GAMM|nr:hypothetical protein DFQ59_1144 [Thioalbus denitrificans]